MLGLSGNLAGDIGVDHVGWGLGGVGRQAGSHLESCSSSVSSCEDKGCLHAALQACCLGRLSCALHTAHCSCLPLTRVALRRAYVIQKATISEAKNMSARPFKPSRSGLCPQQRHATAALSSAGSTCRVVSSQVCKFMYGISLIIAKTMTGTNRALEHWI